MRKQNIYIFHVYFPIDIYVYLSASVSNISFFKGYQRLGPGSPSTTLLSGEMDDSGLDSGAVVYHDGSFQEDQSPDDHCEEVWVLLDSGLLSEKNSDQFSFLFSVFSLIFGKCLYIRPSTLSNTASVVSQTRPLTCDCGP